MGSGNSQEGMGLGNELGKKKKGRWGKECAGSTIPIGSGNRREGWKWAGN
jgi:hypothetical protein